MLVFLVLAYACAVTYSYVWLHHKYGKTHFLLAIFWPLVAIVLGVGRGVRAFITHFTGDGGQLR